MIKQAFAAGLVASGAASGAQVIQTDTFSFPLSPGSTNVSFDGFRSSDGWTTDWQLDSVELRFAITVSGDVTSENDSDLDAPSFGLTLNGNAVIDLASLGGFAAIGNVVASGPLAASDGVDGSGLDFNDFGSVSDTYSDTDFAFGPQTAAFDTAGTLDAVIDANAAFGWSGTTDATLTVANLRAAGDVEVIYNFTVVPAVGTSALAMVAGVGALRRRH